MKRICFIFLFITSIILISSCGTTTNISSNKDNFLTYPQENTPYEPQARQTTIDYKINKNIGNNPDVIAGKTYKFILEGTSKYLIIAPSNDNFNLWFAVENNGNNVFEKEITIPYDAKKINIAFSYTDNRYEYTYTTINVKNNKTPDIIEKTDGIDRIIADIPVITNTSKLKGGQFYEVCAGYNDKQFLNFQFTDGKNWMAYVIEKNEKGFFQKIIQIPADATKVYYAFNDEPYRNAGATLLKIEKSSDKCPAVIESKDENFVYIYAPFISLNKKLKAGKSYNFVAGPNKESNFRISITDEKDNWASFYGENDGNNIFTAKVYIPVNAKKMWLSFPKEDYKYNVSFPIEIASGETYKSMGKKNDFYTELKVNKLYLSTLPEVIETGKFYKIDIGPFESNYFNIYATTPKNNESETLYWNLLQNDGNNHASDFIYLPPKKGELYINARKNPDQWEFNIAKYELKPSSNPYKFKTASDYSFLKEYKTNKVDYRIISYMDAIDAKRMGRDDPDRMIQLCVNKVNEIAKDEYEKIKLLHDVDWYLLSYDEDNYMADTIPDQDYKSILKTNLAVCSGFANLFNKICKVADINCLYVSGYARGGIGEKSWKTTDDPTNSNHAWNIVKIKDDWFIIDTTWDNRQTSKGITNNYYSNTWLFVKPEEFIFTHYPLSQEFQLLDNPVSARNFSLSPFKRPNN